MVNTPGNIYTQNQTIWSICVGCYKLPIEIAALKNWRENAKISIFGPDFDQLSKKIEDQYKPLLRPQGGGARGFKKCIFNFHIYDMQNFSGFQNFFTKWKNLERIRRYWKKSEVRYHLDWTVHYNTTYIGNLTNMTTKWPKIWNKMCQNCIFHFDSM